MSEQAAASNAASSAAGAKTSVMRDRVPLWLAVSITVVVAIGHSTAEYDEARRALEAGARYGTHLFNAMSPLSHREPGLPGALLADERAICGLIVDGVHLHPAAVALAWRALGRKPTMIPIWVGSAPLALGARGVGMGSHSRSCSIRLESSGDAEPPKLALESMG